MAGGRVVKVPFKSTDMHATYYSNLRMYSHELLDIVRHIFIQLLCHIYYVLQGVQTHFTITGIGPQRQMLIYHTTMYTVYTVYTI